MTIPIRNVYYILCYAWKHVQALDLVDVGETEAATLPELLARVLASSVSRLLSHGLNRSYILHEEEVAGVRGKIDLAATIKRNLRPRGRTFCCFDDLDYDTLANRIVKATLRDLARMGALEPETRSRVSRLYRKLDAVADIELRRGHFRRVTIHRNNRLYDFVLRICLLIFDNLVVDERTGQQRFHDFREDEARMGDLFEDFVREFYAVEQERYKVGRSRFGWRDAVASPLDMDRLPKMRTDVELVSPERTIILDTKFYREALTGQYDKRVQSGHLYQILAYIDNWDPTKSDGPATPEGMLLYPVVGHPFSFDYRLAGRRVMIRSIGLDQDWRRIQADLLALVEPGDADRDRAPAERSDVGVAIAPAGSA